MGQVCSLTDTISAPVRPVGRNTAIRMLQITQGTVAGGTSLTDFAGRAPSRYFSGPVPADEYELRREYRIKGNQPKS